MKKLLSIVTLSCFAVLAFASVSGAYTLTGIYEIEGLNSQGLTPSTTSFEGLTFTGDTLWITTAPNGFSPKQLLEVELNFGENTGNLMNNSTYSQPGFSLINYGLFSPVGLASNGTDLFVTNNLSGGYTYTTSINGVVTNLGDITDYCPNPEGASYLGEFYYVSCQNGKVFQIDPQSGKVVLDSEDKPVVVYDSDKSLLGLGATEDSLIIGTHENRSEVVDGNVKHVYKNTELILYNIATQMADPPIDLNALFEGENSQYFAMMQEIYKVDIENKGEEFRYVPDPDGLAYRVDKDGKQKIYMTFEHDLRVYEITLDTPAVPEPGTLLLIGSGLLALAGLRRKRS